MVRAAAYKSLLHHPFFLIGEQQPFTHQFAFESGFTGLRGFLSVGHWLKWCALQRKIKYPPFLLAAAIIASAKYYLKKYPFPLPIKIKPTTITLILETL